MRLYFKPNAVVDEDFYKNLTQYLQFILYQNSETILKLLYKDLTIKIKWMYYQK